MGEKDYNNQVGGAGCWRKAFQSYERVDEVGLGKGFPQQCRERGRNPGVGARKGQREEGRLESRK